MGTFPIEQSLVHSDDENPSLIEALKPYDAGDYESAIVLLEPLVRAGNLLAIFKYANSLDWLDQPDDAVHFWRIAVAAGHMPSRNNLANNLKRKGRTEEAHDLYLAAAEAGESDAMFNLGLLLENSDWPTAMKWFKNAVAAGHAKVCANLAAKFFADEDVETAMFYAQLGIQRQDGYSALTVALHHWKHEQLEKVLEFTDRALALNDPLRNSWLVHALSLRALALVGLNRLDESWIAYQDCLDAGADAETLSNLSSAILAKQAVTDADLSCRNCGAVPPVTAKFCTNCGQVRQN